MIHFKIFLISLLVPAVTFAAGAAETLSVDFANIYRSKTQSKSAYDLVLSGRLQGAQGSELTTTEITIPVEIVGDQFGIDLSFQWAAAGDTDSRTGGFRRLSGKKVSDIFGTYRGKAGNLGLLVIGGGYHQARHQSQDIVLAGGAAALLVGPAGAGGVNVGVTLKDYFFTVVPASSDVKVKVTHVNSKWEFQVTESVVPLQEILSLVLL